MQKAAITSGVSLLPPCRAGSDYFASRIYLIMSSYAHKEIKEESGDLKTLYLPGQIIMMKIVLVEFTPKIHLVRCYKAT